MSDPENKPSLVKVGDDYHWDLAAPIISVPFRFGPRRGRKFSLRISYRRPSREEELDLFTKWRSREVTKQTRKSTEYQRFPDRKPAEAWFDENVIEVAFPSEDKVFSKEEIELLQSRSAFSFKSSFVWDGVLDSKASYDDKEDLFHVSRYNVELFDSQGELHSVRITLPLQTGSQQKLALPHQLEPLVAQRLGEPTGLAYLGRQVNEIERSLWLPSLPLALLVDAAERGEIADQVYLYKVFPADKDGKLINVSRSTEGGSSRPAKRTKRSKSSRKKARPIRKKKKKRRR